MCSNYFPESSAARSTSEPAGDRYKWHTSVAMDSSDPEVSRYETAQKPSALRYRSTVTTQTSFESADSTRNLISYLYCVLHQSMISLLPKVRMITIFVPGALIIGDCQVAMSISFSRRPENIMTVPSVFFAILASIAIQQVPLAQASLSPLKVVDLGYAKYQTDVSLEDGVTSFLGIRYAAPPTGKPS